MRQIEDSYISGYDYSTLTAACCLGERIFNLLIIKVKQYYQHSAYYKHIYRKDSIQDWKLAIDVLSDWKIIQGQTISSFQKLGDIRNSSVHYEPIADLRPRALSALHLIMTITNDLFGLRPDVFFWAPGEPYIRKDKEKDPIVIEFFVPNCQLVGHKHFVEGTPERMVFRDKFDYESREVDDNEFRRLREEWRKRNKTNGR